MVGAKSGLGEGDAFGDLVAVPERAILVVEQDEFSVGRGAGGAARLLQQHEAEQARDLGFGKKLEQEPAEADGFVTECCAGGIGGVALVEDEIDDVEDGGQAGR